jgi:hypothetical protein
LDIYITAAKLLKKLVKAKRFWKINTIRPEIKAIRERMRKFNLGLKANWGRIGEGVRLPNNNPKIGMPILLYSFETFKATKGDVKKTTRPFVLIVNLYLLFPE